METKKKIDLNIANKLTILRVLLIPVFIVLYMTRLLPHPWNRIAALAVFALASYTDHLDGYLARSRGLVTDFGKFMDPLADKLLVISALICFVERGELAGWIVIIIVAREFIISGFRLVAASKGVVIAAATLGKIKTVVQMIMAMLIILGWQYNWYQILITISAYLSMILSIASVIEYIYKNREVLYEE